MKIALYLGSIKNLGGAERRLARIFDRIADPEYDVSIIVPEKRKREEIQQIYSKFLTNSPGAKLIILPDSHLKRFQYTYTQRFDVICYFDTSRYELSYMLGGVFSKAKRLWIICDYYMAYRYRAPWKKRILFFLYRISSDHLDSLYPGSDKGLRGDVKRIPVSVTPCPFTDTNIFYPEKKARQIVFIARLEKCKGGSLFINAVSLCADQLQEKGYEIILAGNGKQYEALKNQAEEAGLGNCIKMPGYVNPEEYLRKAEIFCSLQEVDNYPSQSLIEAITCGCFIIATNSGNTGELVKEGFGRLAEPTPEAVSRAILQYINSAQQDKERFSANAVLFAQKKFDKMNSVRHYKMLFRSLCNPSQKKKEG